MGSSGPDETSALQAAELLGITLRTLQEMVKKGTLAPLRLDSRSFTSAVFRTAEVTALVELRSRNIDLSSVASMGMRAYALSRDNERRLTHISELLGLGLRPLNVDEESVVALYIKAQDAVLDDVTKMSVQEICQWADIFQAIDEDYLRLVTHYTRCQEPWFPFFELVQLFCKKAPREQLMTNRDLAAAFARLEMARRQLRAVMYFYCRTCHGRRAADASFLEMEERTVDAEMISLLYPS